VVWPGVRPLREVLNAQNLPNSPVPPRIHYVLMTFSIHFMTRRSFRLRRSSPGHRQTRPKGSAGCSCVRPWRPRQIQVHPPPPSSPEALPRSASGGCLPSPHRIWRRWPSCCRPKPTSVRGSDFCCHGGILNFFWLALLRRPALSGALSLTLVVALILLSRLKHDIVQMTANFVDLMVRGEPIF
jgi:hypothetical protein